MDTALLIPQNAGILRKLGAVDAIGNVMAVNPDDAEIQDLGAKLQEAISGDAEKKASEEAARQEAEKIQMIEAERLKAAEQEGARLRAVQDEQERLARIKREREEAQQQAEIARLREIEAKKAEQENLDAEMAAALEAMKASAAGARLKALQEEENRKQQEQKTKLSAETEAARLRAAEEQRKIDELEKKRREVEKMRLAMKKKEEEDSENRQVYNLMGRRPEKAEKEKAARPQLQKSARALFDADEEKDKKMADLPNAIKNFLLAGSVLVKHSNNAAPKPRHIYLSHDLEYLVWKDPKKEVNMKQRMRIYKLYGVNTGRCTPQLQRKRLGKYLAANEECCFSVYGADLYEEERTVDLEAPTPKEAQVWIHALEVLIEYAKNRMMYGQAEVAMRSQKELAKLGHAQKSGDSDDDVEYAPPPPMGDD